jgi:hypothetical protein
MSWARVETFGGRSRSGRTPSDRGTARRSCTCGSHDRGRSTATARLDWHVCRWPRLGTEAPTSAGALSQKASLSTTIAWGCRLARQLPIATVGRDTGKQERYGTTLDALPEGIIRDHKASTTSPEPGFGAECAPTPTDRIGNCRHVVSRIGERFPQYPFWDPGARFHRATTCTLRNPA